MKMKDGGTHLAHKHEQAIDLENERVAERVEEVVADKGYHSNDVLTKLEEVEVRSYIPEPARGGGTGRTRTPSATRCVGINAVPSARRARPCSGGAASSSNGPSPTSAV